MTPKIISKIIAYGNQRWRINADKSWSVLVFGFSIGNISGIPNYHWINVQSNKVPKIIMKMVHND